MATTTTLTNFNGVNGQSPSGNLTADANGGANNVGTVFEIVNNGTAAVPSYASTPTTLVNFNSSNGGTVSPPTPKAISPARFRRVPYSRSAGLSRPTRTGASRARFR
ncbi:hypothetical protein FJ938_27195 [Mesorhizobium sp. B2-4-14]|uniref:hypothetical protein n=1 Tax=Mesorhizobium sp. B2-4-14 TaxID=2589935 RepID=UPI00112D035F|nr:hypothetical protein [Mesorhizobium sp. B2-4-14]TPK96482.1 hypothetical protein FJ938_27195 [Mesorhizobium sp. B2-4-14]